jgi:hypothetical protein
VVCERHREAKGKWVVTKAVTPLPPPDGVARRR